MCVHPTEKVLRSISMVYAKAVQHNDERLFIVLRGIQIAAGAGQCILKIFYPT